MITTQLTESNTDTKSADLQLFLEKLPDLTDEQKTKVIIITDIVKIRTLLGYPPPTPFEFDFMYDLSIFMLEAKQYNAEIEWNIKRHHQDAGTTPPTWGISS